MALIPEFRVLSKHISIRVNGNEIGTINYASKYLEKPGWRYYLDSGTVGSVFDTWPEAK